MKLKSEMIRIYIGLCIIVACSIALIYYYYNRDAQLTAEYQYLQSYSEQLSNEFDFFIEDMNFAIIYVLSEEKVLDGLKQLVNNRNNPKYPKYYKQEAQGEIRFALMNNFLIKNFYQVRIINENGIMLTRNAMYEDTESALEFQQKIIWLDELRKSKEYYTLIGSHRDALNEDVNTQVISMVKEIRGYEGSYIEVQYRTDELEKKLNIRNDIKGIVIFRKDGEILYCTNDSLQQEFAEEIVDLENEKANQLFNRSNMIAVFTSKKSDTSVMVAGDMQSVKNNLLMMKKNAVLIALLIFGVLLYYVNISAGIIVKPVKKLQKIMEVTDLESIDKKVEFLSHIEELDALAKSYERLLQRLQISIIKSKKMEHLHLQAQFESLQSKVSPHFISNVLNVISSRGLEMGDRRICEICSGMVALLRYSTDTRDKTATVEEEIYYLEKYCYIMKARYMQKFMYSINVSDKILKQRLPQLSLQQIVENSIKHGFEKGLNHIEVNIKGWNENNRWYVCIQDNGRGFREEILREIFDKAESLRKQLLEQNENLEIVLGGMGLTNLYLRMYLLFSENMVFEIENNDIGACVTIGGEIQMED